MTRFWQKNLVVCILVKFVIACSSTPTHPAVECAKVCEAGKVDSWIGHRQMCFCKVPGGVSGHAKSNDLRSAAREVAKQKPAQYDTDEAEEGLNPESPR